jgi:hypothetical protein
MSVYVLNTSDRGPVISQLCFDGEGRTKWNDKLLADVSDEELVSLWFAIDHQVDAMAFQDIYIEMGMRGLPRVLPPGA